MGDRYDPTTQRWDFEDSTSGDSHFPLVLLAVIIAAILSIGGLFISVIRLL